MPSNNELRLYLEYVPSSSDIRELVSLQKAIASKGTADAAKQRLQVIPATELHLTIIHLGAFGRILRDIQDFGCIVQPDKLYQVLQSIAAAAERSMPLQLSAKADGLAQYGVGKGIIALDIRRDAGLIAVHAECLKHTCDALGQLLGQDPLPYMRWSQNFRHALSFKPHISLLKCTAPIDFGYLPQLPAELLLHALPAEHDLKQR